MDILVSKAINKAEVLINAKHVKQVKIITKGFKPIILTLLISTIKYSLTIIVREMLAYLYAYYSGR
jgi:hypothetical protein